MQLQGTKISNKGQQDQQKQKHPKQQQQAEKSTRQQQSSACTMGHGNPEEAPESFARSLRSLPSLAPGQIQSSRMPKSVTDSTKHSQKRPQTFQKSIGSLASKAQQRPAKPRKSEKRLGKAKKDQKKQEKARKAQQSPETMLKRPWSVQRAPRPSPNPPKILPKPFPRPSQTLPRPSPNTP